MVRRLAALILIVHAGCSGSPSAPAVADDAGQLDAPDAGEVTDAATSEGIVPPEIEACCTSCETAGKPCQANGCYGGYFCNTSSCRCVPPTANLDGGTSSPDAGCAAESDPTFCARLDKDCGLLTARDNCGAVRSARCGECTGNLWCGGGSPAVPNVCGCTPESAAAFCQRNGKDCGSYRGTDNCGASRTVNCGSSCPAGESCGGSGVSNLCGAPECAPESDLALCARYGKDCGAFAATDNCNEQRLVASCGECTDPESCGSGAPPLDNVCGCAPEDDEAFCSRLGRDCGPVEAADNCGTRRSVDCGGCSGGSACSAAGQCLCDHESDEAFCLRVGSECGSATGADNCGTTRTVSDCGSCAGPRTCSLGHCAIPVQTLALGQQAPSELRVGASSVYWLTSNAGGTLATVSKSGGSVTTLAPAPAPAALVLGSDRLFFSTAGKLHSLPTSGGTPTLLYEYLPTGGGLSGTTYKDFVSLVVDGTDVFFTVEAWVQMTGRYWNATYLGRLASGATQPVYLQLDNQGDATYRQLALNSTHAFFLVGSSAMLQSKKKTHVWEGYGSWDYADTVCYDCAQSFVATDTSLYLLNPDSLKTASLTVNAAGEVEDAQPSPLCTTQGARQLALQAGTLYWTGKDSAGGYIAQVPTSGGPPIRWIGGLTSPENIAVDATRIYWTDPVDQAIYSAPRN